MGKVDQSRISGQEQRWLVAEFLDIELRHRRIKGFRALPRLRQALLVDVPGERKGTSTQAA